MIVLSLHFSATFHAPWVDPALQCGPCIASGRSRVDAKYSKIHDQAKSSCSLPLGLLHLPCVMAPHTSHRRQSHLHYSFLYSAEIVLILHSWFGGRKGIVNSWWGVDRYFSKLEQEVGNPLLGTPAAFDGLCLTFILPWKLQFRVYMELFEGNKTWGLA